MILVDTSIWVDHFRQRNDVFYDLLIREQVLAHPFVIGELAMGSLKDRQEILTELSKLPAADVVSDKEVLKMVENFRIYSRGIGYLDAHLVASTRLMRNATLWTRDRRLRAVAEELNIAARLPGISVQ